MTLQPYQKLLEHWGQTDPDMVFGSRQEKTIAFLENKYDIVLPPDFKTYLLHACPIDGAGDIYCNWLSAKGIKNIPDEFDRKIKNPEIAKDAQYYLFFADHALWAWAWAICCKPGENYGRIAVIYNPETFISDSFEDFVDAYIQGWENVC